MLNVHDSVHMMDHISQPSLHTHINDMAQVTLAQSPIVWAIMDKTYVVA